ncbi:MAG TPA: ATP-binding cassette domain-containing protein [Sediminispirochaeta sp.]|nr:ATP-binding cassette domain-containing protein [Sediminispirochaeta sp.]
MKNWDVQTPAPIIEIQHCRAYRENSEVFTDLNLRIEIGHSCAIIGPNGAGKTTLLKLITQEIRPVVRENSRLKLFGRQRWNVWQLRSRMGIVSDDLQRDYLPDASGEHVILSGFYSSIDLAPHQSVPEEQVEKARRTMDELGILYLKDKNFGEMSTGQQRRFLLGRALIHDPEVLLLDEPTNGLDLQAAHIYFRHLRRLIAVGKTVILVSHRIEEIVPGIERVILLKKGRVFADGPKKEVLISPILSAAFETPVEIVGSGGYFHALPA